MQTKTVKLLEISVLFVSVALVSLLMSSQAECSISERNQKALTGIKVNHLKSQIKKDYLNSGTVLSLRNSDSEQNCLARVIYYEARNQGTQGKYAVADLTLNRTESDDYSSTVCGVIREKGQYPWYSKRKMSAKIPDNDIAQEAWNESKRIAKNAMQKRNTALPKSALFFHKKTVRPKWAKKMKLIAVIEDHKFYEKPKRKA